MRKFVQLIPFGDPISVSSLTPLVAFGSWEDVGTLLFALVNLDATNAVTLRVESSEDGIHPDVEVLESTAPAGMQASIEVGPEPARRYWRLSAYTQGPSYPAVLVRFGVSRR